MLAQKLREAFSRGSRSGAAVLVAGVALTLTLAAAAPVLAQQTATSPTRAAALALAKQAAAAATPNAATAPAALAPRPINTTVPQPSTSAPTLRTGSPPVLSPGALHIVVPQPPQVQISIGDGANGVQLDGMVGLVVFLGALTLLPALFLLMTSFTRILIVLHFLRTALGTQTAPPTQLLVALSVLLTGVVMHPVLDQVNREAIQPYIAGQLPQADAYTRGFGPMREFMLSNTRTQDLETFAELTGVDSSLAVEELPVVTVVSAFVTSELRTAFQMGFVIFLPFVVVDLVVASVLMSLGMFMLPPMMISLPLKLLLFVLADGWVLVVQNLVQSFR
ncbi:MAG: flagellar type III secretion system pore protein FliP [Candidatus Eisenbacteria bacterium]|uniref:Flagellar biosynthetic protein FliP n=1 Tax=Eiseniibacteriota bacterium TaxID=2212470 RepID=A0A849SVZ2_UNCEI|nr:flagellar type III secretion system pore protein FliP [Candidatus Eisenbacteria bacterium]